MEDFILFALVIGAWVFFGGGIGFLLGAGKGRGTEGFLLGTFLGFIGWVVTVVLAPPEDWIGGKRKKAGNPGDGSFQPLKQDPIEEFEMAERSKTCLPPPPGFKRENRE